MRRGVTAKGAPSEQGQAARSHTSGGSGSSRTPGRPAVTVVCARRSEFVPSGSGQRHEDALTLVSPPRAQAPLSPPLCSGGPRATNLHGSQQSRLRPVGVGVGVGVMDA